MGILKGNEKIFQSVLYSSSEKYFVNTKQKLT